MSRLMNILVVYVCRYKLGYSYLAGIIPGTRDKTVKTDMNPFMSIVADELAHIHTFGLKIKDASTNEEVRVRASILQVISDYRGLELFLGVKGSPSRFACFK
jgi:hypothetical protein